MRVRSTVPLKSGREMPSMGLGTWQLTDDTAGTIVRALELGYSMIDTSGDYGTQPGIREGLRRSNVDRDAVFVVTKIEEDEDAYASARANVRELGLDHADLVLVHRPPPQGSGVELWRGLLRAREDGIARDVGVSNYSAERIEELFEATGELPAVNQVEWSPFGHSHKLSAFCRARGIVLQAYSPLTRGKRLDDPLLSRIADRHAKTAAQVLLRWNLQHGSVPLPKANREDHLAENLDVFDFELDEDDLAALDGLNERYSSLGSLPYA